MTKTRLEAFSDGVIAIIITIMVLELKVPHSTHWPDIEPLLPKFLSYILSFVMLGIYWVNHHHLVHTIKSVSSPILWANLHLLFWLSLMPFATAWMGENGFNKASVIIYATLSDLCGIAYYILFFAITNPAKNNSHFYNVLQRQSRKGILSVILYTISIPLSYVHPYAACGIFILVAMMWIVPDRNIEKALREQNH